jgi:uncharacterized protein YnzC (UPF0291/DUF896 family)
MNPEKNNLEHNRIAAQVLSERVNLLSEKVRQGTATMEESVKYEMLRQRLVSREEK